MIFLLFRRGCFKNSRCFTRIPSYVTVIFLYLFILFDARKLIFLTTKQADLAHPVLHVLRSMISSVYSSTRDGSAFCIIFLYLLIRSANKASLNSESDLDSRDLYLPPHLVPLMDIYQVGK